MSEHSYIEATPNNMRKYEQPGLVLLANDGGEYSATAGDYFNCPPDKPVSDGAILAIRIPATYEPLRKES